MLLVPTEILVVPSVQNGEFFSHLLLLELKHLNTQWFYKEKNPQIRSFNSKLIFNSLSSTYLNLCRSKYLTLEITRLNYSINLIRKIQANISVSRVSLTSQQVPSDVTIGNSDLWPCFVTRSRVCLCKLWWWVMGGLSTTFSSKRPFRLPYFKIQGFQHWYWTKK